MSIAHAYTLSLDQINNAILANPDQTVIVQGHMGIGKSSLLKMLAKKLPDHVPVYFDCTTKADSGDIQMPNVSIMERDGYVRFLPHEELGMHLVDDEGKPRKLIIMVDELGKAERSVKLAMTRLLYEKVLCNRKVDGYIFATTNLGMEGLGDLMQPHMRNRITVVTARKPTADEWIEWGIENGVDPTVLGFVKDNPQVMQTFEEVADPSNNLYIYHPKDAARVSFITPRSLEAASKWVKCMEKMDKQTFVAMLIGTMGEKGAMDLMTFVDLKNDMPTLQSIRNDPLNAHVPESAAARCMIIHRTLQIIERDWVSQWMDYLSRLGAEEGGMFCNGVRAPKYNAEKRAFIMQNQKFMQWALKNNHMFAADIT